MINLRKDIPKPSDYLLSENPKRLRKEVINYLITKVPVVLDSAKRYDGIKTRSALLDLALTSKTVSLKNIQLEILRRKRMNDKSQR